jgi:hypothetical protein
MIAREWSSVGNPAVDDPDTTASPAQSPSACAGPPPYRSSISAASCDLLAGMVGLPMWLLSLLVAFKSICVVLGTTKRGETERGSCQGTCLVHRPKLVGL